MFHTIRGPSVCITPARMEYEPILDLRLFIEG